MKAPRPPCQKGFGNHYCNISEGFQICLIFSLITSHGQSSFNWRFPQSFRLVFLVIIIIIREKNDEKVGQLMMKKDSAMKSKKISGRYMVEF